MLLFFFVCVCGGLLLVDMKLKIQGAKRKRSEQQQDVAGQNCCPKNTPEIKKKYVKAPFEIIWNKPQFLNHFYASSLLPLQAALTIHKNKSLCLHKHTSFKRQIEDKPQVKGKKSTKYKCNLFEHVKMTRLQ